MTTLEEKSTWLARLLNAERVKTHEGDTAFVYFDADHTSKWYVYEEEDVKYAWDLAHSENDMQRNSWYSIWCNGSGHEASKDELERYGLPPNG